MQLNEIQKTPYGSFFLLFRSAIREEAPREAARSGQQTAHMQRLKPTILKDSLLSDLHWAFWGPLVNETLPRPPNHPLIYPKYPLLRAIRTLLKGTWGVVVGFYINTLGNPRTLIIGVGFQVWGLRHVRWVRQYRGLNN